jgi:hypothetical protein
VIVNHTTANRTSFSGGPEGINARPSREELSASHESHIQATRMQISHEHLAGSNRGNFASENHGRPATAAMSRVNTRGGNQQARIANGAKSGQLTPRESSHLENREAKINHEVRNDRAANGGRLTAQERAQVNHQQNNTSKQISNDKHNSKTDRPVQQHNTEHGHK